MLQLTCGQFAIFLNLVANLLFSAGLKAKALTIAIANADAMNIDFFIFFSF